MLLIGSLEWICRAARLQIASINPHVESFRLQPVWELPPWQVMKMCSSDEKTTKNQHKKQNYLKEKEVLNSDFVEAVLFI